MRLIAALLALSLPALPQTAPAKIKTLIFSGVNNHNWRQTTPFLKQMLEETRRFDVRVNEWPSGTTAKTLAPFDLVVLDYCGPRWGEATERALVEYVKAGGGLVVFHAASYPFGDVPVLGDSLEKTEKTQPIWPEYRKMVGAYWVKAPPDVSGHGDRHSFRVKFADRAHPIAQGMDESFWATDELYHNLRMVPDAGVKVLASAFDDKQYRGTGKDEPMLWTLDYGKGRVFHTALGHNLGAMQEHGFISTLTRGAEWAATGKVTIPAYTQPKPAKPRVLVVTGGHSYDTSFYTLFDGMNWEHAASAEEAYKNDIRKRYDVLVVYDLAKNVSERAKKNFKDFIESGKGFVVLHHAVASYNDWEWYWREVVGARYVLKAEPGFEASTYKHDEEMFVRSVVARHAVIGDTMPMHLIDETYGKMWFSDKITVLAETKHPGTNGPLVWLSPYDKSKVVGILLGHDHLAHGNASFRQLIRNAVQWAASPAK